MNFAAGDTLVMLNLAGYRYCYAEGLWYCPGKRVHGSIPLPAIDIEYL